MKKIENNDAMLDRITLIATLYYKRQTLSTRNCQET